MAEKCSVIRDLMPLCIDGTASEDSKASVEQHVAGCKPCETMYTEMKAGVEIAVPKPQENPEFARAVKKMQHRRTRRRYLWMLLGVLLTMWIVCAGLAGYWYYFEQEVRIEPDKISFIRSTDDVAMTNIWNIPASAKLHMKVVEEDRNGDGKPEYEMYMYLTATRYQMEHETRGDYYFIFGVADAEALYISNNGAEPVKISQIVHGTPEEGGKIVFVEGMMTRTIGIYGLTIKTPAMIQWISRDTNASYSSFIYSSRTPVYGTPTPIPMSEATDAACITPTPSPDTPQ
ncbi:MAG: zf-HC2 domain-containing protein [Clostridia bacterium]|nr:zf-HC2 domain-containing protein [Clostridia bacterium]